MTTTPNNLPGPEPLSPAAQFVLDAVREICPAPADEIAAAAIRAASAHLGSCNASEELIRIAEELEGHD
jgi:hypothetical protein